MEADQDLVGDAVLEWRERLTSSLAGASGGREERRHQQKDKQQDQGARYPCGGRAPGDGWVELGDLTGTAHG